MIREPLQFQFVHIKADTPYECGLQYGMQAKAKIHAGVEVYREYFAKTSDKSWDEIKQAEKRLTSGSKDAAQVARSLPALIYADKVQTRVARTGFDWPDAEMAMNKVEEEAAELRQALTDNTNVEEELGDLLFAAVNVARLRGLDPEETLMRATDKFRRRFAKVEEAAGDKLAGMGIDELIALWKRAKEEA